MVLKNRVNSKFKLSFFINIVFIVIIFTACLWDIGSLDRIRVVDDGFCYWGIAANISGYDWSELISSSAYYSYGYSLILIPLFWLHRLGLSMTILYRIAIVMNACFLSGCYLMAVYMIKELFNDIPDGLKYIISLFVTLYIGNTAQMGLAWTETFLLFMFWCVLVLLYRVIKKPGFLNILGLVIAVAWLFAIHMRSIGVAASVCIVMLGFLISRFKEIDKKYVIYTAGIAVVFLLLILLMKNYVTNHIYLGTAVNSINNVQAGINRVGSLLSVRGIMDLAVSIIGKLYYVSTASFLLILSGVIATFFYIGESLIKKKGYIKRENWQPKEWMLVFVLLSFLAEIGIEAIFQCIPFFRTANSQMRNDSFAFGRYADFVMGPMIILGIWTVYHIREHYKEIITALLISIAMSVVVQFFYNVIAFRKKSDTVGFRFAASPWLAMLADGYKTDFACGVMMISIGILIVFCVFALFSKEKVKNCLFGSLMMLLAAVWGILGVIGGMEYTDSKLDKEKFVDTVARIVEITGDETPIYMAGTPNTEVKILQWLLADRSIHTCSLEEIDDIDIKNAVILGNSSDMKIMSELSDRLDFLYDSGYISVYASYDNEYYEALSDKAEEMAHAVDPSVNSILLSNVATEFSYTKFNGGLYYNYEGTDGGYMTEGMGLELNDGIYEFDIDMRVRECAADTEIGYITVGDTDDGIQYTHVLNSNDFIRKERQTIRLSLEIKDWAEPLIGIYTYGNSAIKICGITYRKVDGSICLDSDEISDIAAFLGSQNATVCYIDSDNSGRTGFPWWKYGKLDYIPGSMIDYKENLENIPYLVEKTDDGVVNALKEKLQQVYETESYIVFN